MPALVDLQDYKNFLLYFSFKVYHINQLAAGLKNRSVIVVPKESFASMAFLETALLIKGKRPWAVARAHDEGIVAA